MIGLKVTNSEWAKLEIPVVPNTSESPTAARASIRPKLKPLITRCTNWSKKLVTFRSPSPMKKLTETRPPGPTWTSFTFGVSSPSSTTAMPSGRVVLVEGDRVVRVALGHPDRPLALDIRDDIGVDAVAGRR